MSDEYEEMDAPQFDGEPVVATEPEPTPEPSAAEPTPEPEVKTPEQEEEHKRLTGSARQKARAERAEREADELRERIARLEGQAGIAKEPVKSVSQDEPKLDDYPSFAEYNAAAIDYRVQKALAERETKQRTETITQSWEQKKAEARKDIPDFDEALMDMETPAPVVVAVMNESEHTAKIAYHLANHPEELQKINKMPPAAAALAVARIEATFQPKSESTPKRTTQAPPPVKPVSLGSAIPSVSLHTRFEEF